MPTNRPTDQQLRAWRAFLTAHTGLTDKLSKELQSERGLPLGWYGVLLTLKEAPEQRLRMNELADSMLISKSAATRFVDRLETAGLVTREKCPSDLRGFHVRLTDDGYAELRGSAPVHLRGIMEHFVDHLTADELEVIERAMHRLSSAPDVRP